MTWSFYCCFIDRITYRYINTKHKCALFIVYYKAVTDVSVLILNMVGRYFKFQINLLLLIIILSGTDKNK